MGQGRDPGNIPLSRYLPPVRRRFRGNLSVSPESVQEPADANARGCMQLARDLSDYDESRVSAAKPRFGFLPRAIRCASSWRTSESLSLRSLLPSSHRKHRILPPSTHRLTVVSLTPSRRLAGPTLTWSPCIAPLLPSSTTVRRRSKSDALNCLSRLLPSWRHDSSFPALLHRLIVDVLDVVVRTVRAESILTGERPE